MNAVYGPVKFDIHTANEFHENSEARKDGTCYSHRRNGATQTWKRDTTRFRIPVKYGLRGYGNITELNAHEFHTPDKCNRTGNRRSY